ncbi:hypothetical protein E2C01_006763 [Portunus trituberculatus]|uniref:Uncharacterized protein n=1 Tax=Portunus trituberculatus TaxID=210409 RepID=A0A5B7CX69_PORTR|nr:hypothetical protein [Portunus trituberculatus]
MFTSQIAASGEKVDQIYEALKSLTAHHSALPAPLLGGRRSTVTKRQNISPRWASLIPGSRVVVNRAAHETHDTREGPFTLYLTTHSLPLRSVGSLGRQGNYVTEGSSGPGGRGLPAGRIFKAASFCGLVRLCNVFSQRFTLLKAWPLINDISNSNRCELASGDDERRAAAGRYP